ncbi:MAG: HIT family protein [Bacteroidales bacterium]|nr:HIT family protein [Bacteroidales bacterium]
MASVFTKIINGDIPCYKIAEDDNFISFLDINPVKIGHALIVPKAEVDYIFDNTDETLAQMMVFAKKVAIAIKKEVVCKRIGIMVVGLEVPHTHMHLIPMDEEKDLSFANTRVKLSPEEFTELLNRIKKNL